jgi:hypothetical protein
VSLLDLGLEVAAGTTNLLLLRCRLLPGEDSLILQNSQLINGVGLAKIRQLLRDGVVLLIMEMLI